MALRLTSKEAADKLGLTIPKKTHSRAKNGAKSPVARRTNSHNTKPETTDRSPLQRELYHTLRLVPETSRFHWLWECQNPVPDRRFTVDIALILSPRHKLALEVDGFRHHGINREGFYRDREKDFHLEAHHWRVLRIPAGMISKDINLVLERVACVAASLEATAIRDCLCHAPEWFYSRWLYVSRNGLPSLPWRLTPIPSPGGWFQRQHAHPAVQEN